MKVQGPLLSGLALGLVLTGSVDAKTSTHMPASSWEIGPIINGRNYSLALPGPSQLGDDFGLTISPNAEPHYVTFSHGSLRGKTQIRMRYRVDGPRGAVIHGAKCSTGSPSAVTLYFQREDDDWATDGGRWWATFASVQLNGPMAEREIVVPLNANWTSVLKMTAGNNPDEFSAAKAHAGRVGFTFANCDGYGHGARATVPVRFVVTRFQVL
jgi:hypothetical protein